MKTTLKLKLLPSADQHQALVHTLEVFNAACNYLGEVAFENGTANKLKLQKLAYHETRERFGLPAQLAVRAIAKVCEAYKRDRSIRPTFRPHGSAVYDQRVLSFKGLDTASILSLAGRLKVPIVAYAYASDRITAYGMRGQADLILERGTFYLCVVVELPEPLKSEPKDWLGVDMGVVNITTDSDGENFSGAEVNGLRRRHASLRSKLQSKGSQSATRRLKQQSGKEARFARDVNHRISKHVVAKAQGTDRGIAVEDLTGIRERVTVRKAQRRALHSWGFHQLASFVEYKAALAGVPFVKVDPKNTSRTCPGCGHVAKENRPTRDQFLCVSCGLAGPADHFAAVEIGRRAAVNQPYAGALTNHLRTTLL